MQQAPCSSSHSQMISTGNLTACNTKTNPRIAGRHAHESSGVMLLTIVPAFGHVHINSPWLPRNNDPESKDFVSRRK